MSEDKKISVIIPVYQVEKYLAKCLDSVINQTYHNLEIILVDDGSTDRCPSICDEYAARDARIKVIHQTNKGLSAARNSGLQIASGELISFVDSDDYIEPRMLEILSDRMNDTDADIVIGNYVFISESGEIDLSLSWRIQAEELNSQEALSKLQTPFNWFYVPAWNKLYRRELFDDISFPEGKLNEDQFVVHKLFSKATKVATVKDIVYLYVQRDRSIMNTMSAKRLDEIEALMERYDYFVDCKYDSMASELMELIALRYKELMPKIKVNTPSDKARKLEISEEFDKRYFAIPTNDTTYKHMRCKFLKLFSNLRKVYDWAIAVREFASSKIRGIGKKYVLLDTPVHGNLGDQAIVLAMKSMVADSYEITAESFDLMGKFASRAISKNKTILIPGGGFLGSIWPLEENRFRKILKYYSDNKIVVFPQTVSLETDSNAGEIIAAETKKSYEAHNNLKLFVREEKSLDLVKSFLPKVNVSLVPDVVMSLKVPAASNREGIVCCLRNDIEKLHNTDEIVDAIRQNYLGTKLTMLDNVLEDFDYKHREYIVSNQLKKFAEAKLVVTDRLHGMLFALITGTPCIVFDNANSKVQQIFKLIPPVEYVRFCNSADEITKVTETLNIEKNYTYDYDAISSRFDELKEQLK